MKKRKEKIGGMALFNGLMLKNKKREAVGIVDDKENITVEISDIYSDVCEDTFTIYDVPIIRGIISMKNMIFSSVQYMIKSYKKVLKDDSSQKLNKLEITSAYIIAITIILVLFTTIPNLISGFVPMHMKNIIQSIIQTVIFMIYLLLLTNLNYLKTLFEYHGAEHKVANAYEKLDRKDITVENVKNESRFHIRCGGNFVVYLFLSIITITLIIPSNNLIFKTILQCLLMPFLIGLSYEFVMGANYLPNFLKFLAYPAMSIQFITTREPSDDKIELAIYTLFGCIDGNNREDLTKCINTYLDINKNVKKDFDKKDVVTLISSIKNINADRVYLNMKEVMLDYNERIKLIRGLNKIYKEHIPVAYVTGFVNFYNERYKVNKNVLIPRPDSEILVDTAIKYIKNEELKTMIDMCTGSGCLGISISKNSDLKHALLVDISQDALEVAKENIKLNDASLKCCTFRSDLFLDFNFKEIKYDIIVSNPPYIPTRDINTLDKSVKKEPIIALDGGKDGMKFYTKILEQASSYLKNNGILIFEIGYDELQKIKKIIKESSKYTLIESIKDFGNNDRVVVCRFQNK